MPKKSAMASNTIALLVRLSSKVNVDDGIPPCGAVSLLSICDDACSSW